MQESKLIIEYFVELNITVIFSRKEVSMKRFKNILLVIFCISVFTGCNDVVDSFQVKVGENSITAITFFDEDFALNLTGDFDIIVDNINYGNIFLVAPTEDDPFQVGVTADFTTFTSDLWEGFAPTNKLPNGDPLPGWITPYELVATKLPALDENFDVTLYVGFHNPYYVGIAVSLNFFDENYPQGLQVSQHFKKESTPWGTVSVYGPTYDENGNVLVHGGLFFVTKFDPSRPGDIDYVEDLEKSEFIFSGENAEEYRNNPEKQEEVLEQIRRMVREFNESRK